MATTQKVSSSRNSLVNYIGNRFRDIFENCRKILLARAAELSVHCDQQRAFLCCLGFLDAFQFPFLQPRTELYTCNLFLRQFPFLVQLFSTSPGIIPLQWPQKWKMGILHFLNCSMFGLFSNSARSIHNFGMEIHPADLSFGEDAISI
jgi:hypothetical protein